MAKFQTYESKINPYAGGAGGAITPMDIEQPVYEGAAKVAGQVGVLGERLNEIKLQNEKTLAFQIVQDYEKGVLQRVTQLKTNVNPQEILEMNGNKGLVNTAIEELDKSGAKVLAGFKGDKKIAVALQQSIDQVNKGALSQLATHQVAVGHKYQNDVISYTENNALLSIKNGGDVEQAKKSVYSTLNALGRDNPVERSLFDSKALLVRTEYEEKMKVQVPLLELMGKFRNERGEIDYGAAIKEANSPEFISKHTLEVQKKIDTALVAQFTRQEAAYKEKAEPIKGELQVDILQNKLTKDDLPQSPKWIALRSPDRAVISSFADAKSRSDRAELQADRTIDIQERQEKKYRQQEEALMFNGKMIIDISDGKYIDVNEIIKAHSVDNPYILSNLSSAISTFNTIGNTPELKQAVTAINTAARNGLLDSSDYKNNLVKQGELIKELRTKYIQDKDFRGAKVDQWIKETLKVEAKKTLIQRLKDFWYGKEIPANNTYSQADLEYTAKQHGISVEEVKKRMEGR